ncbi:hypothetical protein L228DRAFT_282107 [Xylona heveae TC161]|uniref:Mitochondrial intermembrane space import and assembly protein 40 n=1 Tax=Xylona heveae (strain CBS 132557 / TC161) TaxID=1328760 RepID=A0A165HE52_XYLHT|nr:hypothetical protein L228DRAFT_282107 [Xylona heveae TC161]KZF23373.1 hypothetical protein L228DRAFT_282107 [Xylona heveae TC161]
MFRATTRSGLVRSLPSPSYRASAARRFLSTAPPAQKSRSWKSSAVRWGLAIGGIYYYNTNTAFAEELLPSSSPQVPVNNETAEPALTLESIAASRKKQAQATPAPTETAPEPAPESPEPSKSPQEYEEEAAQQGAFNEETGEINWDCPCLGGMAHGPCGEEFKEAFSCFVFSQEEPKGMDCIEKFKGMQDCFRKYPEVYSAELEDDEEAPAPAQEEIDANAGAVESGALPNIPPPSAAPRLDGVPPHPEGRAEKLAHLATGSQHEVTPDELKEARRERSKHAAEQVKRDHDEAIAERGAIPTEWHDMRSSNEGK